MATRLLFGPRLCHVACRNLRVGGRVEHSIVAMLGVGRPRPAPSEGRSCSPPAAPGFCARVVSVFLTLAQSG